MKALKYLLIALVLTFASVPVCAQYTQINSLQGCTSFGQTDRQYQFHTTSTMLYAENGTGLGSTAFSTGVSTGKPLFVSSRPRRIGEDEGFDEKDSDSNEPELPGNPFPVGEGTWFLLLLAAAYAGYMFRRRMVMQAECIENK